MAGETETAMKVFNVLVCNAVTEERFSDASYLHHLLASQCLESATTADRFSTINIQIFNYIFL